MEIFEILKNHLFQSGAPEEAADGQPIRDRHIDVVVDLYGTLDPDVPPEPNSILYFFGPSKMPRFCRTSTSWMCSPIPWRA